MKHIKDFFILASVVSGLFCFTVLCMAQLNYNSAMNAAYLSNGSDSDIECAMYQYGFMVDAMDSAPITMGQKIKALTR